MAKRSVDIQARKSRSPKYRYFGLTHFGISGSRTLIGCRGSHVTDHDYIWMDIYCSLPAWYTLFGSRFEPHNVHFTDSSMYHQKKLMCPTSHPVERLFSAANVMLSNISKDIWDGFKRINLIFISQEYSRFYGLDIYYTGLWTHQF